MSRGTIKIPSVYLVTIILLVPLLFLLVCWLLDDNWVTKLSADYRNVGITRTNGQHIYVPIHGTGVLAVSHETGAVTWRFPTDNHKSGQQPTMGPIEERLTVAVDEEQVYVESKRELYALHTDTGELLWKYNPGVTLDIRAGISVGDDSLVIASDSGQVYAIERTTGVVRWMQEIPILKAEAVLFLAVSMERITVIAGEVWFFDGSYEIANGIVYILAKDSGKLLWNIKQETWSSATITSLPAVIDTEEKIYIAFYGLISAFNGNTGEILWNTEIVGVPNSLIMIEDYLVAIGLGISIVDHNTGALYCTQSIREFSITGGAVLWKDRQTVYYVKHQLKTASLLGWELSKWTETTDLYTFSNVNCIPILHKNIQGNLIAYDPIRQKGIILMSRSSGQMLLKQIDIIVD